MKGICGTSRNCNNEMQLQFSTHYKMKVNTKNLEVLDQDDFITTNHAML